MLRGPRGRGGGVGDPSIDIADVGENSGAKLQIDQAKAEERRAPAEAFRQGNLGVMGCYRMKKVRADATMRDATGGSDVEPPAGGAK